MINDQLFNHVKALKKQAYYDVKTTFLKFKSLCGTFEKKEKMFWGITVFTMHQKVRITCFVITS